MRWLVLVSRKGRRERHRLTPTGEHRIKWGWGKGEEVGEEKHEGEEVGRRRGRKVVSNWRECRRCRELVISSWMFHYFQTTLPLPPNIHLTLGPSCQYDYFNITSMTSNPFIFDDHLHPTDQVRVCWFQSLVFNHVAACLPLPTAHLPGGHKVHLKTSDFYFDKNKLIWMIISFEAKDDVFFQVRTILPRARGGCWRGPPVRFFLHWSYIFETKSSDYDWVIPEDDIFKPRAKIMIEQSSTIRWI